MRKFTIFLLFSALAGVVTYITKDLTWAVPICGFGFVMLVIESLGEMDKKSGGK